MSVLEHAIQQAVASGEEVCLLLGDGGPSGTSLYARIKRADERWLHIVDRGGRAARYPRELLRGVERSGRR